MLGKGTQKGKRTSNHRVTEEGFNPQKSKIFRPMGWLYRKISEEPIVHLADSSLEVRQRQYWINSCAVQRNFLTYDVGRFYPLQVLLKEDCIYSGWEI